MAQRLQVRVKNSDLWRLILNAGMFEVVWFICVWGGDLAAAAAVAAMLTVHFWLVAQPGEWRFIAAVAAVGIVIDSLFFGLGVLQRADQQPFMPLWLMILWLAFATTLKHCFSKLSRFPWLAALLGAIAGPLSYFGGGLINGGVTFAEPLWLSFGALAVCWAILFPALLHWGRAQPLKQG